MLIEALIIASAGLLSVGSITLVILLLISDRGWHNGLGYALGYISAYTIIGVSVVVFGYRVADNRAKESGLFFPILLIILGTLLLWLALRNWRKPTSADKEEPRFFSIVDTITPPKAFGFGAMISVINYKNLALFLTAISVVIVSDLFITDKVVITLLVVLVFCLSVTIPVVTYMTFPKRAKDILISFRQFLSRHRRLIGIWAPLVFGFLFITKGFMELL